MKIDHDTPMMAVYSKITCRGVKSRVRLNGKPCLHEAADITVSTLAAILKTAQHIDKENGLDGALMREVAKRMEAAGRDLMNVSIVRKLNNARS